MAKLAQGKKLLAEGGYEKVFQQEFQILPGEKLLKDYAFYLSTSTGPAIGTLYISTKRMAFCSDYPFYHYSSSRQEELMCYKAVVDLDQLKTVNPSTNGSNPSEKFIHVISRDSYEFWFMGFTSYDTALKTLTDSFQHIRDSTRVDALHGLLRISFKY